MFMLHYGWANTGLNLRDSLLSPEYKMQLIILSVPTPRGKVCMKKPTPGNLWEMLYKNRVYFKSVGQYQSKIESEWTCEACVIPSASLKHIRGETSYLTPARTFFFWFN